MFVGNLLKTSESIPYLPPGWQCVNDEVGVAHSIVHFANDSDSEAVMAFMRFKDGKIILMETGATPLSDDYQLVGQ